MISIAVIITTYNRPDALSAVLEGYLAQSDKDFELIIADDGSTDETRKVIISYQRRAPFNISHIWHEDRGFRAAAIRNRALEKTSADYIIFSDGDCIPLPNFVAMHRHLAEKGWFLAGSRILLSEVFTNRILTERQPVHTFSNGQWLHARWKGDINRLLPLLPLPLFPPLRKLAASRWQGVMTCNLSAWREDLCRINGFDESYLGWGLEDSDLTIRLIRLGIRRKSARFATPVLHLWHRQNPRTSFEENRRRLHDLLRSKQRTYVTRSRAPIKNPKKVLIVVTRRLGDVLLATPLIRTLRSAWPEAQIDALVFENTEGFLLTNPDINQVITVAEKCRLWPHLKFLLSIMRCYDLALSIQAGDRPTFYVWVAGKSRIGMMEEPFKFWWWKRPLLDRWAPFDNINTHTVLMNLHLAELLEIDPCYEVVVSWRPEDEKRVTLALPFDIHSESFVILHMYPKFIRKRWRQDGWVELSRWLEEKGMRVLLTGGNEEDEVNYIAQISSLLSPKTVNMAGKLSLSEVAFLVSQTCLFVGVDTAPTHMAAALGVPTVAIFGPTNPVKWGPWPKGHTGGNPFVRKGSQIVGNVFLLQGIGDCVPCEKGCTGNRNNPSECLQRLPISLVINAAQKALATNCCSAVAADR
jgi:heptosyltransferase-3